MKVQAWTVEQPGQPMVLTDRETTPAAGEVLVEVAGCGVCHTDLGFYYDGVPTRHGFPLTLGHEVAGTVVQAGDHATDWLGRSVVVPAVIPCGSCEACRAGHGQICPRQIFPGSDVHGGFASHLCVPASGLCSVPDLAVSAVNQAGLELHELAVIADAVSTPYQAIVRSKLADGDLAVFVGAGGVGGFGVQVAAALGAAVVAIDVDSAKLAMLTEHGACLTLRSDELSFKELRGAVRGFAKERGIPSYRQKIFETSGTPAGQSTAFGLLGHGGYLSVVGFTPAKLELRLSNLMAFDATAEGNWGCLPEHYPAIVEMALAGRIKLRPFVERRPMSEINQTFDDLHAGRVSRRVILVPGVTVMELKDHSLIKDSDYQGVRYEQLPLRTPEREVVDGLHAVRITLDNPRQYNSYTTEMVKGVIASMRRASDDRACVAVVFTGAGNKAFCTGGNTAEYAEYYAGRPGGIPPVHAAVQRHGFGQSSTATNR